MRLWSQDVRPRRGSDHATHNTTGYAYDAVGHMTGRTDALGASLVWTYDDIGNQIYQHNRFNPGAPRTQECPPATPRSAGGEVRHGARAPIGITRTSSRRRYA